MTRKQPEAKAREAIDAALATAGWIVQDLDDLNLAAGRGVAARELRMAEGHGRTDYLLFVDGQAVGALEAKKEGHTLSGVEGQARKYAEGLPAHIEAPLRPLPFRRAPLHPPLAPARAAAGGDGRRRGSGDCRRRRGRRIRERAAP